MSDIEKKLLKRYYPMENKNWQALQQFYKFQSMLLPDFVKRNARNLGSIEAELIRQYEKGGKGK